MTTTLPTVLTTAGLQPQAPSALMAQLTALVASQVPGYTNNLPGSLIADIAGTDVGAMTIIDQARVDFVNSVTPYGANEFLLNQLGAIYGVTPGATTNTSVNVVFSGTVGFIISAGFTVSDGTYQYTVQFGGIIGAGGSSSPLFCLATKAGSWAVPPATVTSISTSIPTGYTITCTNPTAGTPSAGVQTVEDYRAQTLNAGLVMATGVAAMLTAQLLNVPGVQSRLIAFVPSGSNFKVIVGGGDLYQVAYAIYIALGLGISLLVGSSTTPRNNNISIIDGSNTFNIEFITPPLENVTVSLTWNTSATNIIVSPNSVLQLGAPAIAAYINSIQVGSPINLFAMQEAFVASISGLIPAALVNKMVFSVYINGTLTAPTSGTGSIVGDPESYFYTTQNLITITQG